MKEKFEVPDQYGVTLSYYSPFNSPNWKEITLPVDQVFFIRLRDLFLREPSRRILRPL